MANNPPKPHIFVGVDVFFGAAQQYMLVNYMIAILHMAINIFV